VTRDEVRERFRAIVARAVARVDAEQRAHLAALKVATSLPPVGMHAMQTKPPRRRRLLPTSKRRAKL
jgi:hypothetical protein